MPDMTHEKKNTLLLEYAEKGLTDGVLMALQAGADANHKDGSSDTALHLAATGIVRWPRLLGAGANINAADKHSRTALHHAAIAWASARCPLRAAAWSAVYEFCCTFIRTQTRFL
jgi:ankyrin repeat protein